MKPTIASGPYVYGAIIFCVFAAALAPALLTYSIDPFDMFSRGMKDKREAELAEKSHYPLWKLARYPGNKVDTIVLGDSRARSLRDKYWHEFGLTSAYNMAYGGGTVPEIYATFQHVRNDPNLRTLVVGIQLRSMDEDHKDGLNRVPEALRMTSSPVEYLKNWFVAKIAWRTLKLRHPKKFEAVGNWLPAAVTRAAAAEFGAIGQTSVGTLLQPDVCFGCRTSETLVSVVRPQWNKGLNLGLGRGSREIWGEWQGVDRIDIAPRRLPAKIDRQISKNAKTDWRDFEMSEAYWLMLEEIALWARKSDRKLIFVIPPTIVEMQATIADHELNQVAQAFRLRLAGLAPVIDFDFQSQITSDVANYSDAYHFNAAVARRIVGEIVLQVSPSHTKAVGKKRWKEFRCPTGDGDLRRHLDDGLTRMREGSGCRIWEAL